jgi:metallo-beta-lactamase family protein
MHVTLYGAALEVTGSCYLLETGKSRLLVDCGMFQGSKRLEKQNRIPAGILSKPLDAVLLTHGHLDHCGRLPLLAKGGYSRSIFATDGTQDIAHLILNDAAKIQQDDAERENRKRRNAGFKPLAPLFGQEDVERACRLFKTVEYDRWTNVTADVRTRFVEAGHILGSSSIEVAIKQNDRESVLVFSGDLGQWDAPIMRNPAQIDRADAVFLESTYGDRNHRSLEETVKEFEDLIKAAVARKGKVLIPTFAVGRTQELLYYLATMFRKGLVEPFPIYLDSPMAIAATEIYEKHLDLMDEEARKLELSGQLRKDLITLKPCLTAEESKALNKVEGPCLILAGAGMCDAGRILHHLRHNLNSPSTLVIIAGYQANGSLGRQIIEGATVVKIFGETVRVRATIKALGGFSAHAGQSDLIRWLTPMTKPDLRVVLTHGESHQMNELAARIENDFGIACALPRLGESISI